MQYDPMRARHGPVHGPVNAFIGALFMGAAGRVWDRYGDFPLWIPLFLALCGVGAAVYTGMRRGTPTTNITFRVGCWVFPAAWATWIIAMGWSVWAIVLLAGLCIGAGVLAPLLAAPEPPKDATPEDSGEAGEILKLIVKYGGVKQGEWPTVRHLRDWKPSDAGSTWEVKARRGSNLNWTKIRDIQLDLATALDLPHGCPVEAEPAGKGFGQGTTHLKVSTRNYLEVPIDFPMDFTMRSIKDYFDVGHHLDATLGEIEMHQSTGLIVSQRGKGKTNLLQVITAKLVLCPDAIVWHIDLNNGSMSAAWMRETAKGTTEFPAIDWVAVTAEEALRMVEAAIRIAKHRRAVYTGMMMDEDETILPVAPHLPAIIIIVDEAAEVTGEQAGKVEQAVSEALQELQRIGRAMCVHVLFSSLRGTGDYMPSPIKKQTGFSFCGGVKDESELAYVFDWHNGLDPKMLTEKGQFFYQVDGGPVRMLKVYRMRPKQIQEICHAVQPHRRLAVLDPPSVQVAGPDYQTRWQRDDFVQWLAYLRGQNPGFFGPGTDPAGPPPRRGGYDDDGGDYDGDDALGDFVRSTNELAGKKSAPTRPAPTVPPPSTNTPEDEWTDKFLNDLDALPTYDGPRPAAASSPPPAREEKPARGPEVQRGYILQILEDAGADGLKVDEIVTQVKAALKVASRSTVYTRLNELAKKGEITQENPGATDAYARWWLTRFVQR